MSPEERNTSQDNGEATGNNLAANLPALAAARKLARTSLSRLRTAISPLARYAQGQLGHLRLPDTSLSRRVIERTRPLLAAITGRATSQPSGWRQLPNLIWWGQPQGGGDMARPSTRMYRGGEVSPDTIPQTPASESGYQPLSSPDSYPSLFREPLTSYPAPTDQTAPGRLPDVSRLITRKMKDTAGTPAPAAPKTQAVSPNRLPIKTVRSSVEEPAAPAAPITIKSASGEATSRQPEVTTPPPEPAAPEGPPPSPNETRLYADTPQETAPIQATEGTTPTPSPEAVSKTKADSEAATPETTPLAVNEPPVPVAKPVTPTVEPLTRPAAGILNRLKSAWPELGRNIIRRAEKPLAGTRVIQSRFSARSGPALPLPTVMQPTLVRSRRPVQPAVAAVTGAATTPAFQSDTTPARPVSHGSYDNYVKINQTYQPAQPEMPLSPASLRPATGVNPPSLPNADASDTGLSAIAEYITEPLGNKPVTGYARRESTPASSYYGYSQEALTPRSIQAAYAPRPGQISRKPAAEDVSPGGSVSGYDTDDALASARPEPVHTTALEPVPALIQARPYYGGQPVPELSLAPADQSLQTETQAASPTRAWTETPEETGSEASPPDIDAIARDVYRILKRRLARERERSLGLS